MKTEEEECCTGSFCTQCGFDVRVDEDGCCITCGGDAIGPGVEEALTIRRKVKELETWVNDLHSGMWINCVYCGHRYGPRETTPISMADVLKEHIEKCPKHPMSKLKFQLLAHQKIVKYAQHSLGSERQQGCNLLAKGFGFEKKCTCGLSDVLVEIR
jgi:hypothetical protein